MLTSFFVIAGAVLFFGDLLKKYLPNIGSIIPIGVHILAFLLFILGIYSSYRSWNEDYTWQHLILIPFFMASCVYAASLVVILQNSERRKNLFKLLSKMFN